jgi:DNA-binding response OmpR family regulator
MKVMVVEDEETLRNTLKMLLESVGHEAKTAANGLQALELFESEPASIILSDWLMPGVDGLELCKKIRARQDTDYCYFILLTAKQEREDYIKAMSCGVDDFLTKPLNVEDLTIRLHVADRILGYTRHIERLESLLPLCRYCKKIRNDDGSWTELRDYISRFLSDHLTRSICPSCAKKYILNK